MHDVYVGSISAILASISRCTSRHFDSNISAVITDIFHSSGARMLRKNEKSRRRLWYATWFLVICGAAFLISMTPSYDGCRTNYYQSADRGSDNSKHISTRIGVILRCEGFAIDENADLLVALFTGGLWLVTLTLWLATKRLAEGAEETMQHDLRAYIAVDFDPPGLRAKNGTNMATIRVRNLGKTPAVITDLTWRHVISDSLPTIPEYADRVEAINLLLGPGQTYFEKRRIQKAIDQSQFVIGYVDYTDVFDGRWRTGYARRFKPERDDSRLYSTPEEYQSRTNLVPVSTPGYNYDRKRTGREPPNSKGTAAVASAPSSSITVIYTEGE